MKIFVFLFFVLSWTTAISQNGKLLTKSNYVLTDSVRRLVKPLVPDINVIESQVDFYHIVYSSDGLQVKGYMAIPKKPGKYPCIIYNRGGNRELGKIDNSEFVARGLGDLSKAGYVVVASQYRGVDGGQGKEEFGGKDINDVLNLVSLLATIPQADTSRIGMFGWSRGGMMTYLALTKTTRIKAAVVGSGLTDLLKWKEERQEIESMVYEQLIPDYTSNKTEALKARSAIYVADQFAKTPILILQGTADWRNPTATVLRFVDKLYQLKHPFRFVLYEGGEHALTEHRKDYIQQIINWFNFYVRDKKTYPSLEPHGD